MDSAFTISGLPQCTEHGNATILQLEQSCDLWLDSTDWSCADHMHSPRKSKTSLAIHTKLSRCRVSPHAMSYQAIRGGYWKKGSIREVRINQPFYITQRINPLGSTLSLTSMLYCIYSLILLLWV
ncbi:unnamed protein product [Staurois parvus]|uniref:Uncharacterized protein n=1 Tax=Staurois parvus TaxID=386267 RepID=A0ABN9DX71_9NEOB|nr:unnamed protein product [Staurois parvus]